MEIGKLYRFAGDLCPLFFKGYKNLFFCMDGTVKQLEDNAFVVLLENHDRMSKILVPDGTVGIVYTDCLQGISDEFDVVEE